MPEPQFCQCQLPSSAGRRFDPDGKCAVCGGLGRDTHKRGLQLNTDLLPAPASRRATKPSDADLAGLQLNLGPTSHRENGKAAATGASGVERLGVDRFNRRANHRGEQRKLCRMLGAAVLFWASFSLLPGGVCWQRWLSGQADDALPFWLPLFVAFGSAPLFLGVLIILVPDWTTLKSSATGLLAVACGYAFTGSLFALARSDHRWLGWLQFPFTETGAATLWCLSMMILAGVLSLLCYLEGQRWRRIEQLFDEIQNQSKTTSGTQPA